MEKSEVSKLHCVLVHGTFASDATWVEEDSPLATALLRLEPNAVRVSNFRWTGHNTHTARVQAAKDLSTHLTALISEDKGTRILLVGHSHGGNVILQAAEAIPTHLRAGAVCLASPLFHVRVRSTSAIFWMLSGLWIAAFATLHSYIMTGLMSAADRLQLTWLAKVFDWFPSYPAALSSVGRVTSSLSGASMGVIMIAATLLLVGLSRLNATYAGQQLARSR